MVGMSWIQYTNCFLYTQIVDLLKVYLHRTGDTESGNQLEALGQRLASTATLEEVETLSFVLCTY